MKRFLSILGLLGLTLLTLTGCNQASPSATKSDNKGVMLHDQNVTIVQQTPLNTVDISKVTSFAKLRSSTEGLFRQGKNGHLVAGLASKTSVSHNDTVYDFTLRKNARWSNGQPITASDFVYSWKRTIAKSTHSVNANLFAGIKNATKIRRGELPASKLGVVAVSAHHLRVTLDHPIAYFKTLLAYPLFAPQSKTEVQKYGKQYGKKANTQLYSGPFKLVKWRSNCKTRVLKPNPYYWDKKHVYLHSLTITTATSLKTDLKRYRAGKLDEVQLFDNQITENKHQPDYVVRPFSSMRFISYNFKTANKAANQLINNQDARLAISHAIDRKTLIDNALKNTSLAPKGLVTAGLSKNVKTKADFADQQSAQSTVTGNTALAKKEWRKAQKTLNLSRYSLTLTVGNDWASKRVATNIKHQLETKLNHFDVKIKTVRTTTANQLALNGQYQLLLTSWGADYPDPLSFLQIMTANSRFNYGNWRNSDYNKLVIKISNNPTGNLQNRWQQMRDAEKLLMTNQAVTPLYQQADAYLSNPKLNGVVYNISGVVADYKGAYLVK